jgi:3',5'-cyclic AMP phosphodiesterase CpdA
LQLTLAHFSDPHLAFEPKLRGLEHVSKRQMSVWSWQRKRRASQRPDILGALLADLRAAAPDHLAITGDLINFSLPEEFRRARLWLESLGDPDSVSVVPGNHDALVPVPPAQGLGLWTPWMRGDGQTDTGWPWLRVRNGFALIGLSSALPTAPGSARGRVGQEQRRRLVELLRQARERDWVRVVLIHHPLAEDAVSRRKALADRAELRALLEAEGAELLLHGHGRDAHLEQLRAPGPLCLGLPSASAMALPHEAPAHWQLLHLVRDEGQCRLDRELRRWDEASARFIDVGHYRVALRLPQPQPARAA